MLLSAAAHGATLMVEDPFTDGSRSNATGGDTLGVVWFMGQTDSTLTVADDSGGIGTGNALFFNPQDWGKFLGYFGPATLLNPGDSVTLSFNFRFTASPANINAGFRVGLYNSNGTRQTTDADDTGVPGPGDRSDDVGYGFQVNPGSNSLTGLNVYSEAAGNDILGGASPSATVNQGTAGASFNCGTNAHFALFQLALQPGGNLELLAYVDNGLAGYATIAAGSIMTNSFDEVAMEEGGTWSAPLFIDNVEIVTTSAADIDPMRTNWWQAQTGGANYNLSDALVKSSLGTITNNARTWMNSMDTTGTKGYLWSDLTSTTDSSQITGAYQRLQEMALAYATYGCLLYSNATLASDIQIGLNWMFTNRYNTSIPATSGEYDNWWDWEIGSPLYIVDIATYMYNPLGFIGLSNTLAAVDHFVPSPFSGTSGTSTGGNLTDKIRVVAVRGAVARDAGKLTLAANAFSSLFMYVTNGDGFYLDGSYIQHTHHPYNCSYGLVAIQDSSLVLPWLFGSPWQYTASTGQTNVLAPWRCTDPSYTHVMLWVYTNYQPFLYGGEAMDMTRGRAVSRYSNEDHVAGDSVMQWLLELAYSSFPSTSDALQSKAMVKYLAQIDTYRSFSNNVPLQLITPTEQLMADNTVQPRGELVGHWTFSGMDQVVHMRPGWGMALSMSSSRVYNYESIDGENMHGWFQGDGMTYFYSTNDLAQFSSGFWPTVDPYSLPGTTVDTTALANSAGQSFLGTNSWVGGVTLGGYGAAGQDLEPANSVLYAKKSWFMFDDDVFCLGAGITSASGADIQTTALNRKLAYSNTNTFVVNGSNMSTNIGWQTNLTNASWCALAGFGGCYFPGGETIKALRQKRTNSWSAINTGGTTTLTNNVYLTLWFDHGSKPTNASYACAILPNFSSSQMTTYAANPETVVLENTTNAQAVKKTTLNIVAANFWQDAVHSVDIITVNRKASIMTQQQAASTISVAVADPTQTNTTGVLVTLNKPASSIVSADPAITVNQLAPTIQMTVNTAGALGRSIGATFNIQNSPPSLIVPITSTNLNAGLTLYVTNSATDPDLPYQTLTFSLSNSPAGAVINPASGLLSWRPAVSLANTSNSVTVVVTDNGSPPLSATQSFSVIINPLTTAASIAVATFANGLLTLQCNGAFGPDYSIQRTTNLVNSGSWITIFATNQPVLPFSWTDSNAAPMPQRFYRVAIGP
jgi:hyaluronate lyase